MVRASDGRVLRFITDHLERRWPSSCLPEQWIYWLGTNWLRVYNDAIERATMDGRMRLSRTMKVLLGVATAWQATYALFVVAYMFVTLDVHVEPLDLLTLLPFHLCTMLLGFALLATYELLVLRNKELGEKERLWWGVLIFIGGFAAMPVYYVKYVVRFSNDTPG